MIYLVMSYNGWCKKMRIYIRSKIEGERLFIGFMGIGGTGYFTIKHIIQNLEGVERIAYIESPYLQPIAVYEDGVLRYPVEIYRRNRDIFLRIEDIPRGYKGNIFIKTILKYMKGKGIKEVIAIGGLTKSMQEGGDDTVRIVRNRYWVRDIDIREAPNNMRIFGPLATTLFYCEIYRIPALAILAFSDENIVLDPIAVSNAVKTINDLFGYNLSTEDLVRAAHELNEILRRIEVGTEKGEKNIYS